MTTRTYCILLCFMMAVCAGCANITAPTGGKKDKIPPKLIELDPADSLKNTRVKRIELDFDEYINVGDVSKEVALSPMLSVQPTVTGRNKHVTVKIVDSLLEDNTTYRLSFGNAIKDLHEGNPFSGYTYTFSTGNYFDSLQLSGTVIVAATGLPDTGGISVVLYSAKDNDSAVVRHKPKYITRADSKGRFVFKGLPGRSFRIYAFKDANDNLIYDGPAEKEMIAFNDDVVMPGDTSMKPIHLRLFTEVEDSTLKKGDTTKDRNVKMKRKPTTSSGSGYQVDLDTTNSTRRSFDITHPISVTFSLPPQLNKNKITLTYDSAGITMRPDVVIETDTAHPQLVHIYPASDGEMAWAPDQVYTLRLAKGFDKDTAGKDLMPSRFVFHTKEDEDYGIIRVHLPSKYYSRDYVLLITTDFDTTYYKPVLDTSVTLTRLKPNKYTFRIIVDKNRSGKWETGDLFKKIQPEEVIPYPGQLSLRAGYEYDIDDFDKKPPVNNGSGKDNIKPK